ncbi:hypothetical protein L195_g002622 [Trifolium pratense]|uniref:Uncharacterized protein n=1 Tax=Trifolium pratense TaxID=57577 RepID=A0A2K3NSZ6_TRIPR|nr:uncharacterized protein LOC123899166 [Trifolium pratense]PNY06160.1 hypothetical protein L195_g002622 [Trifolium pratense]
MKASLKFRDEQKKPLLRAKIPLSILGAPFQSGIVAGDSKELTLNLSTFFQSGPSLKLAYRPNDSQNPFSLIVKTGTGSFGSPFSSSMLMSCEFNLLNRNKTGGAQPLFMLHFKPRFGDFSFKKSQSSILDVKSYAFNNQNGGVLGKDDAEIEFVESPVKFNSPVIEAFSGGKVHIPSAGAIAGLFSGTEVAARTVLPIRGRAAVNFRWGVRVPAEIKGENQSSFKKVPFLVMDKIGIEHLPAECVDLKKSKVPASGADVADMCFVVKRQMEILQAENGLLKNAVEDLRREFASVQVGGGSEFGKYREFERSGGKGKNSDGRKNEKKTGSDFNGYPPKSTEADASEELKKALRGATTVGV